MKNAPIEKAAARRLKITMPAVPLLRDTKRNSDATNPRCMRDFWSRTICRLKWFDPAKETLVVVILDTRYKIVGCSVVGIGSLSECIAHPREIFRPIVVHAGYAVIAMHNHPSGDPSPSKQDRSLTERLRAAAEILQIKFLDHVIVGEKKKYFSFKEYGFRFEGGEEPVDSAKKKWESDKFDKMTELENAIHRSAALLETMAELLTKVFSGARDGDDWCLVNEQTLSGMFSIALQEAGTLRECFEKLCVKNQTP